MPFSIIPFLLLALPVAEIAVFILVGQHIGLLPTLGIILLTAVVGSLLLRVQGFGLLQRIRQETARGHVPGRELVHGVMIMIAGVLLLTPGFITDTLGFLLFIPALRDQAWNLIKNRIVVLTPSGGDGGQRPNGPGGDGGVIDLEADNFERNPDASSPWRGKDGSRQNGL